MLAQTKNLNKIRKLLKKKNYDYFIQKPLSDLTIDFLDDFSKELKKQKNIYKYSDLTYLMFWTRKSKIENVKKKINENILRIGRGVIFHICPSNVPTNFIYSYFFGLMSGNSNIIKTTSKKSNEKKIILNCIKNLFKKKKYQKIKKSTHFFNYDHSLNEKITSMLSSASDARVVWGSDATINKFKKIWSPERCIDIFFPDRYSIAVIDTSKYMNLNEKEKEVIANKFFYDSYSMNQQGCNSPHLLFWIGKKNLNSQSFFWEKLNKVIEKKFNFKEIEVVDKYLRLLETIIMNDRKFSKVTKKTNNIYVLETDNKSYQNVENLRGLNGMFFQINIKQLSELKNFISKKCQTLCYYGLNKKDLNKFFLGNNIFGIDRVVPIGKSLEIDTFWDGHDIIKSLSRTILIK